MVMSEFSFEDWGACDFAAHEPGPCSIGPTLDSTVIKGGLCTGCGESIIDRFYLFALDSQWHNCCLRCCVCSRELECEGSCYVKDGFIYCKEDYFGRFGIQKCARCHGPIQSGEMVMRAQSQVYHVKCFSCTACNSLLETGDHFGIVDSNIYCRLHYEQFQYNSIVTSSINQILPGNNNNSINSMLDANSLIDDTYSINSSLGSYVPSITSTDYSGEDMTSPVITSQVKGQKRRRKHGDATGNQEQWGTNINMTIVDPDGSYSSQSVPQIKQKRMRTSFKHHQLRIMKQYFGLNHNPDAKDLKQLSQKTGLSKRVLQVWFQNARAKYRRGLTTKDGSSIDAGEDNCNLEDDPSPVEHAQDDNNSESMSDDEENQLEMRDLDSNASGRSGHCESTASSPPNSFDLDVHQPSNSASAQSTIAISTVVL